MALLMSVLLTVAPVSADDGYFYDNFNSEDLDSRWEWVREDAEKWSLTENSGYIRLPDSFV